jgi:transposase-like protein
MEEARRESNARRAADIQRDLEHNAEHDRIMELVMKDGASCPHCGRRATKYRELNETARKRLVCIVCNRSCNAAELKLEP